MKITLKEYGGLAGRRAVLVLETPALGQDRGAIETLARAVAAGPGTSAAPHPDEMGYTLVIDDGGASHTVRCTDTSATPDCARLAGEVRARGARAMA